MQCGKFISISIFTKFTNYNAEEKKVFLNTVAILRSTIINKTANFSHLSNP